MLVPLSTGCRSTACMNLMQRTRAPLCRRPLRRRSLRFCWQGYEDLFFEEAKEAGMGVEILFKDTATLKVN